MGVPKFYGTWILRNRKARLTTNVVPNNVVSLSFDLNSIFHAAAQEIYAYGDTDDEKKKKLMEARRKVIANMSKEDLEKEHFMLIMNMVQQICDYVQPIKILILAVDGVAPLGKIAQQRSRRYRSAQGLEHGESKIFDPNVITPGTEFMFRLDKFIKEYIAVNRGYLPDQVVYSNHLVPGEGEQKIFDTLRARKDIINTGSNFIYGLDADLIILSVISRIRGIYMIRERSENRATYEEFVDIDALRSYIYHKMNNSETALDDFVVLTYFLGNDFIPASPMFYGRLGDMLDYLIDTYNVYKRSLIDKKLGQVNLNRLYEFIKILAKAEKNKLLDVNHYFKSRNPPRPFKSLSNSVTEFQYTSIGTSISNASQFKLDMEDFREQWNLKIFGPAPQSLDLAKVLPENVFLSLFQPTDQKVSALVEEFYTAFAWTYIYYKYGLSKANPNFAYSYNYAPLMVDAANLYTQRRGPILLDEVSLNYSLPVYLQLLAVMPPQSKKSLPSYLGKMMEPDSPIADMFPHKVFVDVDGKEYDRLGIVQISTVQPIRLFDIEPLLDLSDEEFEKYQSQDAITFVRQTAKVYDKGLPKDKILVEGQVVQTIDEPPAVGVFSEATVPAKAIQVKGKDPISKETLKKKL